MDFSNPRSFICLASSHVVASEDICMVHLHFERLSTVDIFMSFFENESLYICADSEKANGGHDSLV